MKEFQIWMEGYAATGESSPASLLETVSANSFDEAVEKYITTMALKEVVRVYEKRERYAERDVTGKMPMVKVHTIWGCRLFDNEADARKYFG